MKAHRFEHAGAVFEIVFERAPEGWVAHIRRADSATTHVIGFPDGPGYDPSDVRGSLIAGCEAAIPTLTWTTPTRH